MGRNTWSLSWSQEECLDLILAYQNQPVLWNPNNAAYFAKSVKQEAWEYIATELDCPVEEIKAKINSLLGSYRRERRKVKSSIDSSGTANYKSRWYAYKHLDSFLLETSELRDTTSKEGNKSEESFDRNVKEEMLFEENDIRVRNSPSDIEFDELAPFKNSPISTLPGKRKRKANREDSRIDEAFHILKKATTTVVTDECTVYGQHIANKLNKYTERVRSIVEYKISNILFEADMGNFDNINTT